MGYVSGWNTNRRRAGVHKIRRRRNGIFGDAVIVYQRIELSKWVLENSDKTFAQWVNTILHEIAHGIDFDIRGYSDHSNAWVRVAKAVGCDGERCYSADIDAKASKYTIVCDTCNHEQGGHKFSRVIDEGRRSCGKCYPNAYNPNYKLRQIQNY